MAKRPSSQKQYAIGVDYGTNSVRALVVDLADGSEVATSRVPLSQRRGRHPRSIRKTPTWPGRTRPTTSRVSIARWAGPSGRRRRQPGFPARGRRRHRRRYHRLDADSRRSPGHAAGMKPEFSQGPGGPCLAVEGPHQPSPRRPRSPRRPPAMRDGYLAKCGGTYSSEWYWSKILHCRRTAPKVFAAAVFLGRAGRLRAGLAHRQPRSGHAAARHLRRRTQGDVQRAMGRPAQQGFLAQPRSGPGRVGRALCPAGPDGGPQGRLT